MSAESLCRLEYTELLDRLDGIPQKPLKKLRKAIGVVIEKNFEMSRGAPKYGNLPRSFSTEKLERFFETIRNPKIKQAFLIQFFYGLRISELQTVREEQFEGGIVMIGTAEDRTKGGNDTEFLPVIPGTEMLFEGIEYINSLSPGYLGKCFRAVREEAGLEFVYGHSKGEGRPLYLLTTHSLRHTAINHVRKEIDEYTSTCFARHSKQSRYGVTGTYFHKGFEELRTDLAKAFKPLLYLQEL